MRYIENTELREWIKESLRKSIFQKAHALAVQTGCEILVKLEDREDVIGSQYYATNSLDNAFSGNGLRKKPQDLSVSGDTGLPISPLVDRGIQSSEETPASSRNGTSASSSSVEDIAQRLSSRITAPESGCSSSAVPMQLTLAEDSATKVSSPHDSPPDQTSQYPVPHDSLTETDITVKIEPMMENEPPDPGVDDNKDNEHIETQQSSEDQMSFSLETGNHSVLGLSSSSPSTSSGPLTIGGMTRDTKLYPVPISPKPYQCAVCHKAFRSVQVLQKHTQTFHMKPQSMHQLSRRGRGGRGRGAFARSSNLFGVQNQPARHLCLACNRVFHGAHQLEDHMTRFHMNPDNAQTTQQPTSFEDSLALAAATQLAGDIPFPSLDDESPENNSQNLEDIPGPSTSSSDSVPQIRPSAGVPFGQPPTSVSAQFSHPPPPPPPPVFGGFATPALPPPRPNASSGMASAPHRGGLPMRGQRNKDRGRRNYRGRHLSNEDDMVTLHQVMSGILCAMGPIATHSSFVRQGPTSLRWINKECFVRAASQLEALNLGSYDFTLSGGVFFKKNPNDVREFLQANPGLASMDEYTIRYYLRVPASVGHRVKEALISQGHLLETQFK